VSKGIKSVRSRVANLTEFAPDLDHDTMSTAVIESFFEFYGARCEPEYLNADSLRAIPSLQDYYNQMADWDWRFGRTPEFTHHLEQRFDWGSIDLHLEVDRGLVKECRIFSDALDPDMIDTLQSSFPGYRYTAQALEEAVDTVRAKHPQREAELDELVEWMGTAIG
jgi:lipoate-protein ligase A